MILSFLFWAFIIYLAYRLVFGLILPIYKTTRQVKKGFREMSERMKQHQEGYTQKTTVSQPSKKGKDEHADYIDFEEVKD
jgi:membrane-anchored glycerophosphoryl diester phosphodiesterase (GDPDase)